MSQASGYKHESELDQIWLENLTNGHYTNKKVETGVPQCLLGMKIEIHAILKIV